MRAPACRLSIAGLALALATNAAAQTALASPSADPFDDPAFEAALPPIGENAATPGPIAELAPPPAPDSVLSTPLPPIATFDATPPPAEIVTNEPPEDARVRYRLELTGLKEIELEGPFEDLSALKEGDGRAANGAQVSARADEDVLLIGRLLRSEGYFDGSATQSVAPVADMPGAVRVVLTATPGSRYNLGKIAITGAAPEPTTLATTALDLTTGAPIVAAVIETAEARVALRLPEQGYPFAAVGARDVLLDPATYLGDYTLPLTAGPRSTYGGIRTAGDAVFGVDHIALLTRFDRGDLYDSRMVDDLRQALVATSLYSTVSVEPVRTGQFAPDGTETVDLLVRETKGPWRTLGAQGGYGTGEGIRVEANWTHRNLFPDEGALAVSGIAGTQQQRLGLNFRRSNAGRRDRAFQLGADVSREDRNAFSAYSFNLNAAISRVSTPIWQKRWTYSYGAEIIATSENAFDLVAGERVRREYGIIALPGQVGYDRSDSLLDPTRGYRLSARVSPEASYSSGFDGYARLLLEGSAYLPATESLVIAGRARLGSIQGIGRDDLAPSRRLYAGGGGSVRGYGFQRLGPRVTVANPDFDPTDPEDEDDPTTSEALGGRALTEFALEARYRFGNFGIVPFIDAGQVYEGTVPRLSGLRYGAGIGGRFYTNFGPLRVDVATPLNPQEGDSRIALYISIGQAF